MILWMVKSPSDIHEHIKLKNMTSFKILFEHTELSKAFSTCVEDDVDFAKDWVGRW